MNNLQLLFFVSLPAGACVADPGGAVVAPGDAGVVSGGVVVGFDVAAGAVVAVVPPLPTV